MSSHIHLIQVIMVPAVASNYPKPIGQLTFIGIPESGREKERERERERDTHTKRAIMYASYMTS